MICPCTDKKIVAERKKCLGPPPGVSSSTDPKKGFPRKTGKRKIRNLSNFPSGDGAMDEQKRCRATARQNKETKFVVRYKETPWMFVQE
jgi:hypothetical protein